MQLFCFSMYNSSSSHSTANQFSSDSHSWIKVEPVLESYSVLKQTLWRVCVCVWESPSHLHILREVKLSVNTSTSLSLSLPRFSPLPLPKAIRARPSSRSLFPLAFPRVSHTLETHQSSSNKHTHTVLRCLAFPDRLSLKHTVGFSSGSQSGETGPLTEQKLRPQEKEVIRRRRPPCSTVWLVYKDKKLKE